MATSQKPARRLACRRCNRQKLQCRWEEEEDTTCIRCRRANAVCTSSTPRRLGRPPQGHSPQEELQHEGSDRNGLRRVSGPPDLRDLAPPNDETNTSLTDSTGWASFQQWSSTNPTTTDISINNDAPGSSALPPAAGPSALLSQFCEDDDLWQLSIGPYPSTPSNIYTTASPLTSGLGTSTGNSEFTGTASVHALQAERQPTTDCQDREESSPLDSQEVHMQKLWSLQKLLYKQLKQLRQMNEAGKAPLSSDLGTAPMGQARATTYPVDQILRSTQAFVDMVAHFKGSSQMPTSNSSRSTAEVGEEASEAGWGAVGRSPGGSSAPGNEMLTSPSTGGSSTRSGSLLEMDMPMVFALLSCYVRLIDVYDEMFRHFGSLLPSLLYPQGQPAQQIGFFPHFQLGEFRLRDCGSLQVSITVKVLLHALRCTEKTIGVFGRNSVAGGSIAEPDSESGDNGQDSESTVDGVLGHFGRDKVAQVMTILERDGPGGSPGGSIGSLRGNIKKVNELLEHA